MSFLKNPLILALDIDSKTEAMAIVEQVGSLVGAIKLGPRLVYRFGSEFVKSVSNVAPVFVDNKYFDIPSTMVSAVRASFEAGATLVTVHALSGSDALSELAKLEKELNQIRPFKILAVTILTSANEKTISKSLHPWTIDQHVKQLAGEVVEAGLTGLVCSGHELEILKDYNLFKVTPGIRLTSKTDDDQKRIMTPAEAITNGASALVVGRPILTAANPEQAIKDILESCKK